MAQGAFNESAKVTSAYCKGRPVLESSAGFAADAAKWTLEHPGLATTAVVGAAVCAVPGLVTAPLLLGLGFGAQGVQASSVAAGVQSVIGNVAAGSIFATMQSAGAGGAGAVVLNGATQVGAATVAGFAWLKGRL